MTSQPVGPLRPGHPSGGRSGSSPFVRSAVVMAALLGLLYVLEALDSLSGHALDAYGVRARDVDGLPEIFTAPLLHAGWDHLLGNSLPFFGFGLLVLLGGVARWVVSSLVSVVSSGLAAWALTPAGTVVLGASGLIFGWFTYLLARGIWTRRPGQVALAVVILLVYGGLLWGVLPGRPGISWQAHLGGAVGGVLAARLIHRRDAVRGRTRPSASHPG